MAFILDWRVVMVFPDEAMVKMDDADDSLFSSIEMPDETASNTNTRFDS